MAPKTPKRGKASSTSLKISNKLFTPSPSVGTSPKKVSFSKETPRDEDDDFTPVRKMVKKRLRQDQTPHPNKAKQAKRAKITNNDDESNKKTGKRAAAAEKKGEEGEGPQKRRKTKKSSYALFSTASTVTSRPSSMLTAQLSHTLETVPAKIRAIKKNASSCHVELINELEKLEADLLKRLDKVSGLKISSDEEELEDKKLEVIEEMEDKILEVQKLKETREQKLQDVRPGLRLNHNKRFVCCPVCAMQKNHR